MKTFQEWMQIREDQTPEDTQRDLINNIGTSLYNSLGEMRQNPDRFSKQLRSLLQRASGTPAESAIHMVMRNFGDFCTAVQQRGFSVHQPPAPPRPGSGNSGNGAFDEYQKIYNQYAQRNHQAYTDLMRLVPGNQKHFDQQEM